MKKIGTIILMTALILGLNSSVATATAAPTFDQELTGYLKEVSQIRGQEVTKDDLSFSLSMLDEDLSDFNDIDTLRSTVGEVINADLSNLASIYANYHLDETSLRELLAENGDELDTYLYVKELDTAVSFYSGIVIQEPEFEAKLQTYLDTVSAIRGFIVTKEDLVDILKDYDSTFADYDSVDNMKSFLGDVIKADLSNLDSYFSDYNLDEADVLKLLTDNGMNINDYVYLDDLASDLYPYMDFSDIAGNDEELQNLLDSIGLTDTELQNLVNYYNGLEDYLNSSETADRLNSIIDDMSSFNETVTGEAPTAEQLEQLEALYREYLSVLKIDVSFSLVKGGKETPVSFTELAKMEDLQGNSLKITITASDGSFLADMLFSDELLASEGNELSSVLGVDVSDMLGQLIPTSNHTASGNNTAVKDNTETKDSIKTVKGGSLPKTSSDYIPKAILGVTFVFCGVVLYRRSKKTGSGLIED